MNSFWFILILVSFRLDTAIQYRQNMGTLLYIVSDAMVLEGPGLVVIAEAASEGASLRVGDAVELRRADGSSLITEIKAFPMVCPFDFERQVPISFATQVSKEDVPIGAEVWSFTDE